MVQRRLAEREYTDVAMPTNQGNAAAALMPAAAKISGNVFELVQARDRMNMNNMLSDANTEMAQLTAKWQTENASNPFDPQAAEKLKAGYAEIFNKYGGKVSVASRGDWGEAQGKMTSQYIQSNLRWGAGQAIKNAESSVNMSFVKGNQFAYDSGAGGTDVGLVNGNFATRADMVRKSLKTVGQSDQQIEETLANHKSDYMKSYVTGAIFRNPVKGAELLNDKDVVNDIGSPEAILALKDYSKKRVAQMNEEQSWQIEDTSSQAVREYVLKPDVSFAQGMAYIEDQYLAGNLGAGSGMKEALERNLKSAKAVDAKTNEKVLTDLLMQVSDAQNAVDGDKLKPKGAAEFLTKIGEIRQKAVNYNSDGTLWRGDLEKIESEITQSASAKKKLSDTTQVLSKEGGWGAMFTYKDAYTQNKYFGSLPASERDGALRDYFYAVKAKEADGARLSNKDRKNIALEVRQNRASDFLSKTNATLQEKNKKTTEKMKEYDSFKAAKEAKLKKGTLIKVNGVVYEAP